MKKRYSYEIEGIVQGVGFRPFVYFLAYKYSLKGYVLNNSEGVEIDIEGDYDEILKFEYELKNSLPPLARIDFIRKNEKDLAKYEDFVIKKSENRGAKYTPISPDMSICEDCLKELRDEKNRRYKYPFINCTNCGPRYSIIKTVPYDRKNTSMSVFKMCSFCKEEYENPSDRRYHAQPVSCNECGPEIYLKSVDMRIIEKGNEALKALAKLINKGNIVALKGMGGFHLLCDALNDDAVSELRKRKKRATKPFAVMFKNMEELKEYASICSDEEDAINSIQKPIVIVKKGKKSLSGYVAPNIDRLGVFLPYTPIHLLLFDYLNSPIVATSANRSGDPIVTNESDLIESLGDVADYYLDYNREIINSSDDSVLQIVDRKRVFLRVSRGYTPATFRYEGINERVLALGAHQKNAIAIYLNNQIILSPYIGDLESLKSCDNFEKVIENFKRFYNFEADIIICDKHEGYHSVRYAKKSNKKVIQIQHHYAHILTTMFEHKIGKKVLGVAWDGTGYGDDGTIWGGEFLVCDRRDYKRVAYFEPFVLLGGEKSIKDIKRVALSIIYDLDKDECFEKFFDRFDKFELKILRQLHKKRINSPLCSSVGRIFDAVASIAGICDKVGYDGESGLLLESFYDESIDESYDIYLDKEIIRYKHIFFEILKDNDPEIISTKFINGLAKVIFEIGEKYSLDLVLSGGVFQNKVLLKRVNELSKKFSKKLFLQEKTPVNDASIAIGQLYSII